MRVSQLSSRVSWIAVFILSLSIVLGQPSLPLAGAEHYDLISPTSVLDTDYARDEFILKLSSTGKQVLNRVLGAHDLTLVRSLLLPGYHLVRVGESHRSETLSDLLRDPLVELIEPNGIEPLDFTPNDPAYWYQWHLHQVQAADAWDRADGTGVIVAVLDSGVAYENYDVFVQAPDLGGTMFVQGYDFYNGDSHPNDDMGHGTHVTGTIAQTTNNGVGVAGLAFGARIMPVKVCGGIGEGCSVAASIDGIVYAADNGARVISMSFGGYSFYQARRDAINYAYSKGVVLVASAGNDNTDDRHYPSAHEHVIAVGATDYWKNKAPYSNKGAWIDFVAPGGDTGHDRNNDGYADGVLQQTFSNPESGDFSVFAYWFWQGTSMSTPHVSALAALLLSVNPELTPDEVYALIRDSALDLGSAGKDPTFGWGLIQASDALDLALAPFQIPDLRFEDVWIEPANPVEGDGVDLFATIQNIGGGPAEAFTVVTYIDATLQASGEFTLEAFSEMTIYTTWMATAGTHTIDWVVDLNNDVIELNEDNNEATLSIQVAPEQRIIITESYVSDSRAPIGTTQTIGFRAVWEDGTPVSDGSVYVNGVPYAPDGDGWVWLQDSSGVVVRKTWSVTGVDVMGVIDYQQIAPDAEITWDMVRVVAVWASDKRADVSSTQQVYVRVLYEYDELQFTQGVVYLNGEPMAYDPATGRWFIDVTNLEVGQIDYRVTGITDYVYELTEFMSPGGAEIVWDLLEVYGSGSTGGGSGSTDARVDIRSFVTVWFKIRWAYDGSEFGAGQEVLVNGVPASWSVQRGRWETVVSQPSVTALSFAVTGHTDNAFDITVMVDSAGPQTVIWDAIECYYLELDDARVNVGESIEFRVKCWLSHDRHELGSGDAVTTDFGSLTWDTWSSWFEISRTQSTVGDYTFTVVSGFEVTYGISALVVASANPTGIYDRVRVTAVWADDNRIDVGTAGMVYLTAELEYDGHRLASGDMVVCNGLMLAWSMDTSTFAGQESVSTVQAKTYDSCDIAESTYGITAVNMEGRRATVVWDRVEVVLAASSVRVDVGSSAPVSTVAHYAYDGALFEGELHLSNDLVQENVGPYPYSVVSIEDPLYGLEASQSNTVDVIFDQVVIELAGPDRAQVGTEADIPWTGTYTYDDTPFVGRVTLSENTLQNQAGPTTYAVTSILDDRYGLTTFVSNTIEVVFDRIIVRLSMDSIAPGQASVEVKLAYASDGIPIDDATVYISGVEARPEGNGIYTATLSNWWVTLDPSVEVFRIGFPPTTQEVSSLAAGNVGLYLVGSAAVGSLVIFLRRRK